MDKITRHLLKCALDSGLLTDEPAAPRASSPRQSTRWEDFYYFKLLNAHPYGVVMWKDVVVLVLVGALLGVIGQLVVEQATPQVCTVLDKDGYSHEYELKGVRSPI